MALKSEVLDRLLLSKSFLDKLRFQPVAEYDRHTLAAAIIAAHDAAELAIAAIASELGCLPAGKGNAYLMDYFDPIENHVGVEIHAKDYFRQLNRVRNNLKHDGIFPDAKQWARVGELVFGHISEWCRDYLQASFADLDESVLLNDENARAYYDEAKAASQQLRFKEALEHLGVALAIVLNNNAALRGLTVGQPKTDDAIRLSGFGVHANDFLALQQFLPLVEGQGKEAFQPQWKQSLYGHPGNWRPQTVEFCLRTFIDVAIKIQGARWIPGAIERILLYEQQIEAVKDRVDIWTEVRVDEKGNPLVGFAAIGQGTLQRQVLRTLKKGETMTAVVRVAEEKTGDTVKDAFYGGGVKTGKVLSVMAVTPTLKDSLFGNVLASDVKVRCVPRDTEWVRQYLPSLPIIDWEPE